MHVAQLGGEVAHGAPADALAPPLGLEHVVEEAADLAHPGGVGLDETGLERALLELGHELIEDRVAEVFLAAEVIVEVALPDPALAEDVVERRVLVAAHVHEPGRRLENRLPRRARVTRPRRGAGCLGNGHLCTNQLVQNLQDETHRVKFSPEPTTGPIRATPR